MAVERFRIAHGRLPERLDDLVPTYLEGVPTDPFDGEAIRYAQLPEGYVVYSIGQNLLDDGGIEVNCEAQAAGEDDITFTVARNGTLE